MNMNFPLKKTLPTTVSSFPNDVRLRSNLISALLVPTWEPIREYTTHYIGFQGDVTASKFHHNFIRHSSEIVKLL